MRSGVRGRPEPSKAGGREGVDVDEQWNDAPNSGGCHKSSEISGLRSPP